MTEQQIFYGIFQAIAFAFPVCGILVFFGRKLQRLDHTEKALKEHTEGTANREHQRRAEFEKIYNRLNLLSETVNFIKGKIEGGIK